jgi:hypothetical protein
MGLMSALLLGMAAMLSVTGSLDGAPFAGYANGTAYLEVELPDGARCVGSMVDTVHLGDLRCPDGRFGSFHWQLDQAGRGYGEGLFDGKTLELTFSPS